MVINAERNNRARKGMRSEKNGYSWRQSQSLTEREGT